MTQITAVFSLSLMRIAGRVCVAMADRFLSDCSQILTALVPICSAGILPEFDCFPEHSWYGFSFRCIVQMVVQVASPWTVVAHGYAGRFFSCRAEIPPGSVSASWGSVLGSG